VLLSNQIEMRLELAVEITWCMASHAHDRAHDARDRELQTVPFRLGFDELLPSRWRQSVVLAVTLQFRVRVPLRGQPALPLEAVERRVQRSVLETEHLVAGVLDVLGDLVAVGGPEPHRPENQQNIYYERRQGGSFCWGDQASALREAKREWAPELTVR
jgi:hypothetical protein